MSIVNRGTGGGAPSDPIVPVDGDQDITGDLSVSGDVGAGNDVLLDIGGELVLNADDGGDTSISCPSASNTVDIDIDGTLRYRMTIYNFQSEANGGGAFRFISPTATEPSFVPNKDATNYGFGSDRAGSNEMTLIGGGSEVARVGNNQLSFFGATAVSQQTGVAVDAAGIHAALVAYGLITGP